MEDRTEWERQLKEELSFAIRTGSRVDLWDLPISLAHISDEKLTAEVLRRGDKLDLAGVLARVSNLPLHTDHHGWRRKVGAWIG